MTADRAHRESNRRAHRRFAAATLGGSAAGMTAMIAGALSRSPGLILVGLILILGACTAIALGAAGAFRPLGISGARRPTKQFAPAAAPAPTPAWA